MDTTFTQKIELLQNKKKNDDLFNTIIKEFMKTEMFKLINNDSDYRLSIHRMLIGFGSFDLNGVEYNLVHNLYTPSISFIVYINKVGMCVYFEEEYYHLYENNEAEILYLNIFEKLSHSEEA